MSMIDRKVGLSFFCILIGYSMLGTYALSLRFKFIFPIEAYWLSFVFVSIPILCEVAFWKSSPKLRLFYLLSFSLMIHMQYAVVDSSPLLSSEDAVADFRLTDKILADSRWVPLEPATWGSGYEYRFYPITNFLYATMSLLTGIPLLTVVKYLFVVKALVVTPLAERFFRSFFDQRVAYLATVIFLTSLGAIIFPHKESFAVIFFFVGMYAVTRTRTSRQHLLIGLVSILTVIMTHHFTTYIFLVLLTSLSLSGSFYERQKTARVSGQFLMLFWVVFAAWAVFVAWAVIAMHQRFLSQMFFDVLLPGQVAFVELMPIYRFYERIVIWIGLAVTAISVGLGFLRYVRRRKNFSSRFFGMMLVLGLLLVVASVLRFASSASGLLISHRAYEFGYILVGAFSAYFFVLALRSVKRLSFSLFLICAIFPMILVGPMAGAMHPRTFAKASAVISSGGLSLSAWIGESVGNEEYVIGDKLVNLIVEGYGDTMVFSSPDFLASPDFTLPTNLPGQPSYIVTYLHMIDFYGPNTRRFNASPYFDSIYTNGILTLYKANPNY